MPSPAPPTVPVAPRRARRAPALVALVAVLALGGAVAGVYGTGVVLGSRLAPSGDGAPTAAPGEDGGRGPSGSAAGGAGGSSLPDRVADRTTSSAGADGPATTVTPAPGEGGASGGRDRSRPFPAMWPYASWGEVEEHLLRGDAAFASPDEAALRFAREVVGSIRAAVAGVGVDGDAAVVDLRTGGGRTEVRLERLVPPGAPAAGSPWGVLSASGDLDVVVPAEVGGPVVPAVARGGDATLAVSDRRAWRGISTSSSGGVRVEPGPAGPVMVLALGGDPRDPSAFAARPVELAAGAGVAGPRPPADPLTAAGALAQAATAGDVAAAWDLLAPSARSGVLDWRGLAVRLPELAARLEPVRVGVPLTTTEVPMPVGPVSVVTPTASALAVPGVAEMALPMVAAEGGVGLARVEATSVGWAMDPGPALVATGPVRPAALALDGSVVAVEPVGDRGGRVSLDGLPAGPHLAVAVVVVEGVAAAAAHGFTTSAPSAPTGSTGEPSRAPEVPAPPVAPGGGQRTATSG